MARASAKPMCSLVVGGILDAGEAAGGEGLAEMGMRPSRSGSREHMFPSSRSLCRRIRSERYAN